MNNLDAYERSTDLQIVIEVESFKSVKESSDLYNLILADLEKPLLSWLLQKNQIQAERMCTYIRAKPWDFSQKTNKIQFDWR